MKVFCCKGENMKKTIDKKMEAFNNILKYQKMYEEGMISVKELRDMALYTAQEFGLSLEFKHDFFIIHTPFTDGEIIKVAVLC